MLSKNLRKCAITTEAVKHRLLGRPHLQQCGDNIVVGVTVMNLKGETVLFCQLIISTRRFFLGLIYLILTY